MRALDASDAGTTAIVGFAVCLVIFSMSFAAFLAVLQAPAQRDGPVGPALDAAAASGLVDVLDTTGYAATGATRTKDWAAAPDTLTRLGLATEGRPGLLDPAKLRAAGRGGIAADPANGLLDYEEARAALGLGQGSFHLRTEPLWEPLGRAGPTPIARDVAYVGDFASTSVGASNYPVQNTSAVQDLGTAVRVNVTVVNNGTVATLFQVQFRVPMEHELEVSDTTPLLAPGQSWTASLRLVKSSLWTWKDPADQSVSVTIQDPVKKVGDFKLSLAGSPMIAGPPLDRVALTVDPRKLTYDSDHKPKVEFYEWDHRGEHKDTDVNLTVRNATTGTAVAYFQGPGHEWELPAKLPEGAYNVSARLLSDPGTTANDTIVVKNGALGEFTAGPLTTLVESTASRWERGLLKDLVQGFANTTYNASSGDVYLDQLQVMEGPLADNLTAGLFHVLVVGSGVDHAALAGASARAAVAGFVQAGGLLVVLGSAEQQTSWLQPLLDASTASREGVDRPDPGHPILHAPQALDHGAHLDGGRRWTFPTPGDGGHFTHVLGAVQGGQAQDVLAVSRAGHFGSGAVVLTAWQLAALTPANDRAEALATLYNFLRFGAAPLYLEVGPVVPAHADVASAARVASAVDPGNPAARLLVRVTLWAFR